MKLIGQMYFGRQRILSALKNSTAQWEWTPARLLRAGGHWAGGYDPASGRLFNMSAGTTPVVAPNTALGYLTAAGGGMNATQATALIKPTVACWPKTGRRNLLNYSAITLGTSMWSASGGILEALNLNALGKYPGVHIASNGSDWHRVQSLNSALTLQGKAGEDYTLTVIVMRGNSSRARSVFRNESTATESNIYVNMDTGVASKATSVTAGEIKNVTSVSLGEGIWKVSHTVTLAADGAIRIGIGPNSSTVGDYVIGLAAQIERGSVATAFQDVITANDIREDGVPSVWHLHNDGDDRILVSAPATKNLMSLGLDGGVVLETYLASVSNMSRQERQVDVIAGNAPFTAENIDNAIAYWRSKGFTVNWTPSLLSPKLWIRAETSRKYTTPTGIGTGGGVVSEGVPGGAIGIALSEGATFQRSDNLQSNASFTNGITGWTDRSSAPATFVAQNGWGVLTATDGVNRARASSVLQTIPGRPYTLVFRCEGTVEVNLGSSGASSTELGQWSYSEGQWTINFVATTTTTHLTIHRMNAGTARFTDVGYYELNRHFATQGTALARPTFARLPRTGVRNLAIGSGDYGRSQWVNVLNENGISSARVSYNTELARYQFYGTSTAGGGRSLFTGLQIERSEFGGATHVTGSFKGRVISGLEHLTVGADGLRVEIQYQTLNEAGAVISTTPVGPVIRPSALNGWVEATYTMEIPAGALRLRPAFKLRLSPDKTYASEAAPLVIEVKDCQFEIGQVVTPWQCNFNANHVTEAGVPSIDHFYNDGDDSLDARLPAGNFTLASLHMDGRVTYQPFTSNGTAGSNVVPSGRTRENIVLDGTVTSHPALEQYWSRTYG